MKKILILCICTLFFLPSITFAVHADLTITSNENNPPNPPVITGTESGKIRRTYTYYVTVSDPDEDELIILIEVNFSDGTTSCGGCDGRGPWRSGDVVEFEHSWAYEGTYEITGKVQDEHGVWSDWSEPLSITMPYTINNPFWLFLEWLFQRFPHAFPLLRHLMGT